MYNNILTMNFRALLLGVFTVVCYHGTGTVCHFMEHYGHYYVYHTHEADWNTAAELCRNDTGTLLSLNGPGEQQAVLEFFVDASTETGAETWLGFRVHAVNGTVLYGTLTRWEDGTPVNFTNWGTVTDPSNPQEMVRYPLFIESRGQEFSYPTMRAPAGEWRDVSVRWAFVRSYICEFNSACTSSLVDCVSKGACLRKTDTTSYACVCTDGFSGVDCSVDPNPDSSIADEIRDFFEQFNTLELIVFLALGITLLTLMLIICIQKCGVGGRRSRRRGRRRRRSPGGFDDNSDIYDDDDYGIYDGGGSFWGDELGVGGTPSYIAGAYPGTNVDGGDTVDEWTLTRKRYAPSGGSRSSVVMPVRYSQGNLGASASGRRYRRIPGYGF